MKILILGSENSALNPRSAVAARLREYSQLVEEIQILVPSWTSVERRIPLDLKVSAVGIRGQNKIMISSRMAQEAYRIITDWRQAGTKDIVISTIDPYFLGLMGIGLAVIMRCGFELQLHGIEKLAFPRSLIFGWVVRHADSIRAVSHRLAKEISERCLIPLNQITVAPIYVDWRKFKERLEWSKPVGIPGYIFLTVGRLVPVKDVKLQIEALALIKDEAPRARLLIVGDGPERATLEALAARRGVTNQVTFLGSLTDVASAYRRAGCFILTSTREGWGIVLIEALAANIPIISTDVGLVGEILTPGPCLTIVHNDAEQLAKVMLERYYTPAGCAGMREHYQALLNKLPPKERLFEIYLQSWQKSLKKHNV